MRRKYRLESFNQEMLTLEFEWDPDTGDISGTDAQLVCAAAEAAREAGYAIGHPYPTPYKVSDPLRRPSELAVILGNAWRSVGDLAAAYPKAPAHDLPPDATP